MKLTLNPILLILAVFLLQVPTVHAANVCAKVFASSNTILSFREFQAENPKVLQSLKSRAAEKDLAGSQVVAAVATIETTTPGGFWSKGETTRVEKDVYVIIAPKAKEMAEYGVWLLDRQSLSWIHPTTVTGKTRLADGRRLITLKTDELAPGADYAWTDSAVDFAKVNFAPTRKGSLDVKSFFQENLQTVTKLIDNTQLIRPQDVAHLGLYHAKSMTQKGREVLVLVTPAGHGNAHEGVFIYDLNKKNFEFANDQQNYEKLFLPDIQMSLFLGGEPLWQ